MKTLTQANIVTNQLKDYKRVSRNWCLERRITRLGAITCDLEKKGWTFNAHYEKTEHGKDYVYELVSTPPLNFYQKLHQYMQNASH